MANGKTQYALEKGTELCSLSKNILGIPSGEKRVYTIEKTLGQGGFGITYLATGKIGNITQTFAIKEFFVKGQCWREAGNSRMMFPEAVEAQRDVKEWLHEFENEAELLNRICKNTPNIVQVNEVFRANNTAYYVMEYLEGGSLRDIVKQGSLQEDTALSYILPIVKAVHVLHTMEQPLLHCDIKHDNIMLRRHLTGVIEPVLIDFGESRHFSENGSLTTTHTTAGCSRGFAPMEQYLGITTFSPQVDVYALAATLYYIVTGDEPPFADDVTEERIRGKLPERLSGSLKNSIIHGMQKDKSKRTCDTRTFYKEISGKDIEGDKQTKAIVISELPIGHILRNNGKQYEIVSVVCQDSFYIRYKATCVDDGKSLSSGHTQRIRYDIYELFDKEKCHRQEDKSVIADGNITISQKHFLNLCKKVTAGEVKATFRNASNLGWVTFTNNNTYYLVDTHHRKSLPWKQIYTYGGICIGSVLLIFVAIDRLKEVKRMELQKMSLKLTNAIASNNTDSLKIFAEDYDSARAYLPYAQICLNNGDLKTARIYATKAEEAVPKDSLKILNLRAAIIEKESNASTGNQQKVKEDNAQEEITSTPLIDSEKTNDNIDTDTKTELTDAQIIKNAIKKTDIATLSSYAKKGNKEAAAFLANHYVKNRSKESLLKAWDFAKIAGGDTKSTIYKIITEEWEMPAEMLN